MATHNVQGDGNGGLDGSIRFELDRAQVWAPSPSSYRSVGSTPFLERWKRHGRLLARLQRTSNASRIQ